MKQIIGEVAPDLNIERKNSMGRKEIILFGFFGYLFPSHWRKDQLFEHNVASEEKNDYLEIRNRNSFDMIIRSPSPGATNLKFLKFHFL